ncbi:homocitrate synthase [Candidatus Viridilinea mediisalina]|uniref:Homocitrate synthase n=1 Tax=Candidatus Viridilinea mediisalina TaxID=2024553 RepID=A0A2A6RKB1_9CHLR|nr:homocitrate synthase [Candidatus Viridilinea mediisalina]PDW03393.1 homocitrate synthase [Candidatus Viridilinea mediisalina]
MSLERCFLLDTTLREGEQFATARFTSSQRLAIAEALDAFGVEYIELTSPAASPQSARDLELIARHGLRARILAHVRCHLDDVRLAVEHGAQGVNLLYATSAQLRQASHGRSLDQIVEEAAKVIAYLHGHQVEIRFSCEDTFRTELHELIRIYRAVAALGIERIGLADTVGIATPRQVYDVVAQVRREVDCDIEFHGHNDAGCAIANAFCALEAGATHIDVTVLGIGERNGIASLGGMVARLATFNPDLVARYDLTLLPELDRMLAEMVGVSIPFDAPISSPYAFHHKAGLHTKAVLADPRSYEVLDPAAFGRTRTVAVAHRLVGWHAIAERARELGIYLNEAAAREAAARIKALGDEHELDSTSVDEILYEYAE